MKPVPCNRWKSDCIDVDQDGDLAKDSSEPKPARPIRRLLSELVRAPAILSIVWPITLMFVGYFAWEQWGADHFAIQYYGVKVENIHVNDPPRLIEPKVRQLVEDVYEDAALDQLSLLDPQASAKIASAFSGSPWVRRVVSVRKLPGGKLDVRLAYRRPVAMLYVEREMGFLPIDEDGSPLPDSDFSQGETEHYIHLHVPGYSPRANDLRLGQPFRDARIQAATRLAAFLQPVAEQLQLRIVGAPGDPRQNPEPQLELWSGSKKDLERYYKGDETALQRYYWGSAPGRESRAERTADTKLEILRTGVMDGSDLRIALLPSTDG